MEYKSLSRVVYLAAGLFVALWFVHEVLQVILLFFFAIVFTIVLNGAVTWLERRKVRRTFASLIVFFSVLLVLALLVWMVVPKIVTQVELLVTNLPNYLDNLNHRISKWLGEYGTGQQQSQTGTNAITLPPMSAIINSLGQYSIQLFKNVLLIIFFFCLVIYMLLNPRPLL